MAGRTTPGSPSPRDLGVRVAARRKGAGLSLRDASAEIGISFNTLARVERGHLPDLANYRKLQAWLGELDGAEEVSTTSTPEVIADHLRTDPLLPAAAAEKIASIVRDLYEALSARPASAPLHLRAARTFTPDAAQALSELLARMQSRLDRDH